MVKVFETNRQIPPLFLVDEEMFDPCRNDVIEQKKIQKKKA